MNLKNIYTELKSAALDINAGIKIIKLNGNKDVSIYAAEINPNTPLNPHYHSKGIEFYQIIEGNGIIKTNAAESKEIEWKESVEVTVGDSFCIKENVIHQIANQSDSPLRIIFTCPESHMGTDRHFIN